MKVTHALLIAFLITFVFAGWNTISAMPAHPDLLKRIQNHEIAPPYYLEHEQAIRNAGVDSPTWLRPIENIRQHNLDEDARMIVILVDFSDKVSHVQGSSFDSLLFGSYTGTLRNFYHEVSYGNLTLVTVNFPSALGWRRAPQTYAYYCNGNNGFGSYPQNAQKLTEDAVALVDPVVDFSQYDNDGDGYVDALFVVHSGPGAEFTGSSNDIWSHQWEMNTPQNVDGVIASIYSMEPEYWQTYGDMTCGVYAHEMGHSVFGLPDLYDYGYDSRGLGRWSLMAGGSWNGTLGNSPSHPDVWSRLHMGFVTPTNVVYDRINASIPAIENNPVCYRLWTNGQTGSEYFLIENRQQTGYDATQRGNGLLIYHVDEAVYGNDNQWYPGHTDAGHYEVALEQADGLYDLERYANSSDSNDPYPGGTNNRTFNNSSLPNSQDYAFNNTSVVVNTISNSGSTMTANLYVQTAPSSITVTAPSGGESWTAGDPHTITWTWQNFSGNVAIEINRNYPAGVWTAIASDLSNSGSYPWTVALPATPNARIRVTSIENPAASDISDNNFTIYPQIPVVVISKSGNNDIRLDWNDVGATNYQIFSINKFRCSHRSLDLDRYFADEFSYYYGCLE